MVRRISSTAFLGTLLLASAALAAEPSKPASEETAKEGSKPAAAATSTAAPAAETKTEAKPAASEAAPVPPPPPPPEIVTEPEPEVVAPKARKRDVGSAGLSTQSTTVGGGEVTDEVAEKDWGFKFKGYFRAPMRVGIDTSGHFKAKSLEYHAIPVVPDGNYTRWSYTNLNPGPWAELMFQYGNQRVMMTTAIASYNITTGGWRELQDQLGIDRAFLTLKFPEALGDLGGMAWDVGIFGNLYGAMGKYNAGEYETYLIGRTRVAGATATMDMDVADDAKLIVEFGGGAKVDQQYQRYTPNTNTPTYDYPSWQPYPGQNTQQGTNLLFHGHAGALLWGILTAQAHYIGSFVKDSRWNVGSTGGTTTRPTYDNAPGYGYIQVAGVDFKLNGGWMGDGYIGYSMLKAKNALTINDSIEVLHSQGGWQLAQNYFPDGNGTIHSIAGQYTFSLAGWMMRPRPFWGQGVDLTIRPFFMYNKVTNTTGGVSDVTKFKGGLDIVYSFLPLMAAGLRVDTVNPDMDNSEKTFYIIAPRLVFRSEWVTHESIVLQYSYYKYGAAYTDPSKSAEVMPWPFGQYGTLEIGQRGFGMAPDKHVVTLYADMWW